MKIEMDSGSQRNQEPEEEARREIILSTKGLEQFEFSCTAIILKESRRCGEIVIKCVEEATRKSFTIKELSGMHCEIQKHVIEIAIQCTNYLNFLNLHHSDQSNQKMDRFQINLCGYRILRILY